MTRTARQTRPQLVCVLADNSDSMRGEKAAAATEGIRELLVSCQVVGPRGRERSYFRFVLIKFGETAEVDENCNMRPVREIDAESIEVTGDGGKANMTAALELAYDGLQRYMQMLESHPERSAHPLPLVVLFSDGRNEYGQPERAAERIKSLAIDGDPVVIAAVGVSPKGSGNFDEEQLRRIASADSYVKIGEMPSLVNRFLVGWATPPWQSPSEVAKIINRLGSMGCE